MKQILIVGTNELAQYYIDVIQTYSNMKIIAIIQTKQPINTLSYHGIPIYQAVTAIKGDPIDYIFCCEDAPKWNTWGEELQYSPVIFNRPQLDELKPFVENFILRFQYMKLILNNMRDGLVTIDADGIIQFMNDAAKTTLNISPTANIIMPISELIPESRLPKVLQHQEKEVNQKLNLGNGRQVVSTRIPLTNQQQHLIGAFAIFKDSREILQIAEENTNLKKMKTMLEAVIHASNDPVCIVDEHAHIQMVNEAYIHMTGMSEKAILGQSVNNHFPEEARLHRQVLQTRRPVIGTTLEVGLSNKEMVVNASPIMVRGKLKGSAAVIRDISEVNRLTKALTQAKGMIRHLEATNTFNDIVGISPEMKVAKEQAKIGSQTSMPILLRGASGTGKQLFAQAIHHESKRKHYQFIQINCAAVEEGVLERKLFGVEHEGFINGGTEGKKGFFEEANKGSVFLDEIGALSLSMQTKLLKVLKEQVITRVGGTVQYPLDIRIIVATNVNLEVAIPENAFKKELYDRLSRFTIYMPTLNERKEDLPELIDQILAQLNHLHGKNATTVSDRAMNILHRYHWPKNIHELKNVISRAIIFMKPHERVLDIHHLPQLSPCNHSFSSKPLQSRKTLHQAMEEYEKEFIQRVYKEQGFNKTKTSEALGISVRSLYYKLEKYETQITK